jgi:hypothetical protein
MLSVEAENGTFNISWAFDDDVEFLIAWKKPDDPAALAGSDFWVLSAEEADELACMIAQAATNARGHVVCCQKDEVRSTAEPATRTRAHARGHPAQLGAGSRPMAR